MWSHNLSEIWTTETDKKENKFANETLRRRESEQDRLISTK